MTATPHTRRSDPPSTNTISRRTVFAGAGVVGAVAAVAATLPGTKPAPPLARAPEASATDGGYQLTEHVKRYYQTARV